MVFKSKSLLKSIAIAGFTLSLAATGALAKKPNIILMLSDDTGWGDLGVYGGGEGRGMATPNLDKMADEGMQFWSAYGQPSCTPGRAAAQTGRFPLRSGMTTVAFQGQPGGLPHAEWTIASVLKKADYNTVFIGKWHLGESDYAYPINQGYDEMYNVTLYHLNAYTYCSPTWNPTMSKKTLDMFRKVTKGVLEGKANKDGKIAQAKTVIAGKDVWEHISELDTLTEKAALDYIEKHAHDEKPFYMSLNWAKNHQPNLPAKEYAGKSTGKTKYSDAVVEMDSRSGHILDKLRELGIDKDTLVIYTVDNGAWQDVYPDSGYTPFRGTKGTDREGGSRVPFIAWWPGHIPANTKSHTIIGGIDMMATFAAAAGIKELPKLDRAGEPIYFDSINQLPVMLGKEKDVRTKWYYFTEQELAPGAVRDGRFKFVFNLRGDDGAYTGSKSVSTNRGWKGPSSYVATVPEIYDLMQDPQERYDIFMTNWTEKTWATPKALGDVKNLIKNFVKYPPRPLQSEAVDMPYTIDEFAKDLKAGRYGKK